jgi:hypothetical protein
MSYGNTNKDGTGTFYHTLVNSSGEQIVIPAGIVEQQSNVTDDDSDKTFTVPAGFMWDILSVNIKLTSSADAGNRQICLEVTDGTNVILSIMAGIVQAASLTRYYNFYKNAPNLTAFIDTDYLSNPLPDGLVLLPGYTLRVYDKAAIAAAADDMHVRIMLRKFVSS